MKSKKALLVGAGAFALLVGGLLVAPSFVDWSQYQSLAQEKLRDATGYDLKIDGALRVALLPSPHASISKVTLAKAGSDQPFLVLDNADVALALLPLLTGKVEVASVVLDRPVMTMLTNKDGTDNWSPAKTRDSAATTSTTDATTTTEASSSTPAISVGSLKINEGSLIVRNDATGSVQTLAINELHLKADALTGPFDADGRITYNKAIFDVELSTGGYRAGESLPVQLSVADDANRATLKYSGIVATDPAPEAQGELDFTFTDLSTLMADAGLGAAIALPQGKVRLNGMLTANQKALKLANGAITLGGTKSQLALDVTGITTTPRTINASVQAPLLDVSAIMALVSKASAAKAADAHESVADTKTAAAVADVSDFIPAGFALPADIAAKVQLKADGLTYNGTSTGAATIDVDMAAGRASFKAEVTKIPDGGNLALSGTLAKDGTLSGKAALKTASLTSTLVDWLKVVDASTLKAAAAPEPLDGAFSYKVAARTATLSIDNLSLGQTKIEGGLAYTKDVRPMLDAQLKANSYNFTQKISATSTGKTTSTDKKVVKAADFKLELPILPFDVKFDLGLGRLNTADMPLSDIKLAGEYNGKALNLTRAAASLKDGSIALKGTLADFSAMSGIDMQVALSTSDLESFVQSTTGTPLTLPQKIGKFSGTLKATGSLDKLAIDAGANALGFTATAKAALDKPLSNPMPKTLDFSLKNPSFVQAMRTFVPGFGATSSGAQPLSIAGTLGIDGQAYELSNLKASFGDSDLAGALKADMSGKSPSIKADLSSTKLDLGALMGVERNNVTTTKSASTSTSSSAAANAMSPWTRQAIDSGFLHALNADITFKASQLLYGAWVLSNVEATPTIKNGALNAPFKAGLYEGTLDATLAASSQGAKTPLSVSFKASASDVAANPLLKSLTGSSSDKASGKLSLDTALKTSGISSGALVSALAGNVDVKTDSLVINGMDLDKLAANIVEAFDGGWKGVLSGITSDGLASGSTAFKDVDHSFPVAGGNMSVKDFTLVTTSANATLISNGNVNFASWRMDLDNQVQVTQPKDVPVIGMRLSGPLNAPQKSVSSTALDSLLRSKIADKVSDKVTDKVKNIVGDKIDSDALKGVVNGLFGR